MAHKPENIPGLLKTAEQARKRGDISAALNHYGAILARMPDHAKAKKAVLRLRKDMGGTAALTQADVNQLVNLLNSGDFQTTATQARILLVLAPTEPLLYNILGVALSRLKRHNGAIAAFRSALRLRPAYPEVLGNLGGELLATGALTEAETTIDKAIAQKPDLPEAWHNRGLLAAARGLPEDALIAYDRALRLRPTYGNALNSKGAVLSDLMRYDAAIACFKQALKLTPNDIGSLTNLAYAHAGAGDDDLAMATLSKVLALDPDNAQVLFRLGVMQGQRGDKDASFASFDKALALEPKNYEIYRTKSTLTKFSVDDPQLGLLDTLLADPELEQTGRMHLSFARGKMREDIGDFSGAFADWNTGNAIRYQGFDYTPARDQRLFAQIKDVFSAGYFNRNNAAQDTDFRPIFIIGMNRSGTSLVEQILASHTDVFGAGELVDVDFFARNHLAAHETGTDTDLAGFAGKYRARLEGFARGEARIIDKLPINFMWVGLIKTLFPNASIVHLSRDARDNCLSIYKNYFDSQGNEYAYDLEALAAFYLEYKSLMAHWDQVLPGAVYTLSYEDLTTDLTGECRKLLAHCGLEWQDAVLEFHKSDRVVKTASIGQVRQKVYKSSVQSWKRFEHELAPLITALRAGGVDLADDTR
jgi:Flp pilus assembly protein TadD